MTKEPRPAPGDKEGAKDPLPPADQLITLGEAADYSGLSYSYLGQIAQKGRLRGWTLGMQWFTTREAVDRFIASRQRKGRYREDIGS